MPFISRNPYTEEVWKEYASAESAYVESQLQHLHQAFFEVA
jgi:acyl-CoA reductase-like NAD-dependent aldehyde dehydrogenase